MIPSKKKGSTKRSRTGCRTCRARHVKCDETPGSCKRCLNSGWKCEGYDIARLSYLKTADRGLTSSLALYRVYEAFPGVGPEEKRGLAFFQNLNVPALTSFFDNELWTDLVLPMCYQEPAVSHAVVALSVLHEDCEARGVPLFREDLSLSRHRFALGQHSRSLAILNQRRYSQDPKFLEVVLTCCYLFIAFDLMRDNYDSALLHLKQGLAIVYEIHGRKNHTTIVPVDGGIVAPALEVALTRLRDQSFFFDIGPAYTIISHESVESNYGFKSLQDARLALDGIVSRLIDFVIAEKEHMTEDLHDLADDSRAACFPALFEVKRELILNFETWKERLDYSEVHTMPIGDQKDARGLEILRLHHLNYYAILQSALLQDSHSFWAKNVEYFEQMIVLCERILGSFQDEKGTHPRPTLVLEIGVNASLFFVYWRCQDSGLRHRAVKLMEEWPHREGLWDSIGSLGSRSKCFSAS